MTADHDSTNIKKGAEQHSSGHIGFLDPLRGAAILAVFAYHAYRNAIDDQPLFAWSGMLPDFSGQPWYMWLFLPFNLGVCGVAMFFVVSGFCIHLSHHRRASDDPYFRDFFVRRVLRIFPPYLVALLLFAFVYPFGVVDLAAGKNVLNFFAHLFLVHNFFELEIFAGINPSFWSVAIEAQLYLLYPLLFLLAQRIGWRKCLIVCAAIEFPIRIVATLAIFNDNPLPRVITGSPFAFLLSWSIGAALADAYLKKERLPFAKQSIWFWLGLCLLAPHVKFLAPFNFLVVAVATGVFVARSLNGEHVLPNFRGGGAIAKHLALAGTVSYSCYLFHQPLLNRVGWLVERLLKTELNPLQTLVVSLATWPAMLALSWLLYRLIEVPSITLAKSVLRGK